MIFEFLLMCATPKHLLFHAASVSDIDLKQFGQFPFPEHSNAWQSAIPPHLNLEEAKTVVYVPAPPPPLPVAWCSSIFFSAQSIHLLLLREDLVLLAQN